MHFVPLNDWHIAGREKKDTGAEIWIIILHIDGLEELEEDARMIVMLMVVMMIMPRFQDGYDDKNNTEVVSSDGEVSGCE
jgi:hypothetical protein